MKDDEPVSYRFEDARTLHEIFQRGKRESSKLQKLDNFQIKLRNNNLNFHGFMLRQLANKLAVLSKVHGK